VNRKDFYFKQKVTEAELDAAFDDVELALRALVTDLDFDGISYGLDVIQQPSPNLTVQVAAGGAYDQAGRRITIATTQNLDLAVDESALNTAVVTPGNERWLSIFLEFDRALSVPRVDGNSVTVYFHRSDSFVLNVASGGEATIGAATRPPLRGDQLLLADVRLVNGQTTIVTANISTTRRELRTYDSSLLTSGTAEYAYETARTRTVRIPFGAVVGTASYAPQFADGTYGFCGKIVTDTGKVYLDLTSYLRTGATLTGLSARVKPGAARASTNRMALQVFKKSGALVASQTQLGSTTYDDASATEQDIAIVGLTQVAAGESYFAVLTAGSTATANPDFFFHFTLTFADPGPRNY